MFFHMNFAPGGTEDICYKKLGTYWELQLHPGAHPT